MQFVAIDLETTGLNPRKHGVIEFGAVYADLTGTLTTKQFQAWINPNDFVWDAYCLKLHAKLIESIHNAMNQKGQPGDPIVYSDLEAVGYGFKRWLHEECSVPFKGMNNPSFTDMQKVTAAGKNFGSFDLQFLLHGAPKVFGNCFRHRSLDPTAYYIKPEDEFPPDLKECKLRAGFTGDVAHRGLSDAWDIVDLLQWKFKQ